MQFSTEALVLLSSQNPWPPPSRTVTSSMNNLSTNLQWVFKWQRLARDKTSIIKYNWRWQSEKKKVFFVIEGFEAKGLRRWESLMHLRTCWLRRNFSSELKIFSGEIQRKRAVRPRYLQSSYLKLGFSWTQQREITVLRLICHSLTQYFSEILLPNLRVKPLIRISSKSFSSTDWNFNIFLSWNIAFLGF